MADFLSQLKAHDIQATLKPTPCTVVTFRDGTRFIEKKDGSLAELPNECVDEIGQWGILDEKGALGLSDVNTNVGYGKPESTSTSSWIPSQEMLHFISEHPELSPFLRLIKMGAPLGTVQMRLAMEEMAGKFTNELAAQFIEIAMADGLGSLSHGTDNSVRPEIGSELKCEHFSELHGHLGDPTWEAPRLVVACEAAARPGYASEKGHEYLDSPAVLRAKVKVLAELFRRAKRPVVYAGAGLSTASGINDYATRTGHASILRQAAENARAASATPKPMCGGHVSPFCAAPNLGHRVLASMAREGLLWRFVQQNHDGLPQKAGMPQHVINEIHGGWFDPSNPVVAMSGNLRGDLFDDLLRCERQTDLVLAVGSSLCGMNADRLVKSSADRARKDREKKPQVDGNCCPGLLKNVRSGSNLILDALTSFGSVIVSVQKTVHDHNSSLRIFGLIDDVMELLAEELNLRVEYDVKTREVPMEQRPFGAMQDVFSVPYGADGERLKKDTTNTTNNNIVLDLRLGSELRIASGPDKGARAMVMGKNKDGHFRISVERATKSGGVFKEPRLLGSWWPFAAAAGEVERIPLVNIDAMAC